MRFLGLEYSESSQLQYFYSSGPHQFKDILHIVSTNFITKKYLFLFILSFPMAGLANNWGISKKVELNIWLFWKKNCFCLLVMER